MNKGVVIALSIIIGLIVLLSSCGAFAMYLNSQAMAEEAKKAREQAESAKLESERLRADTERRAAAEKLAREEAERKAEEERLAREEQERLQREEQERLEREEQERLAAEAARRPDGEVISVTKESDWEFVNGEADAGFKVTTVIKNNGPAGDLQIVTFLSCSQGEWSRTQHLFFNKGQAMSLKYFFHEPTISVTNCQARAAVSP